MLHAIKIVRCYFRIVSTLYEHVFLIGIDFKYHKSKMNIEDFMHNQSNSAFLQSIYLSACQPCFDETFKKCVYLRKEMHDDLMVQNCCALRDT